VILVTGGSGQLARALEAFSGGRKLRRVGRPEFDFDRPETVTHTLQSTRPSLVINAAAWTAVDAAESNAEAAARANHDGPALIAHYCASAGIPLIHISTDYVFDGSKGAPYLETDAPNPIGVYGATKRAGEEAVLAGCPQALIVRTSWVFADSGKNFVLTMLNARRNTDRLRVVGDQRGCPTAAPALAAALLTAADRLSEGWSHGYAGLYHACGAGETTWHGLATALFEEAERHGVPRPQIDAIATADWPTPVRRPADSRLECGKLARVFGVRLPDWRDSLADVVDRVFVRQLH
jgi:dTDP-4-dehydrorhamnose reductase